MWYQSEFQNTRPDWFTCMQIRKKIYWSCLHLFLYKNIKFVLQENWMCWSVAENGSQHNNPDNIYVKINNPTSELIQIVIELKDEIQIVKHDNERILELNQILLENIHNKENREKYITRIRNRDVGRVNNQSLTSF